MDNCHLSNVTKWKKNHCPDQAGFGLFWRLACTLHRNTTTTQPAKEALTTDIPLRSELEVQVNLHSHSGHQVRSAPPSIFKTKNIMVGGAINQPLEDENRWLNGEGTRATLHVNCVAQSAGELCSWAQVTFVDVREWQ